MSKRRPETRRHKRSLGPGCLAVAFGLPLLTLLILWCVFLLNNRPPNITVPTPPLPANNAYDDFLRAAQMARGIQHKSPISMINPPTDDAGLLKASADCAKDAAPALAMLRQGLPKPYRQPAVRSFDTTMTQFASFRELARTLYGIALYYELSGQPGKAVETMLDGEEMGVMIPHGGAVISDLVGEACESISRSHFEQVLPRLSLTELAHVARRLEVIASKRQSYAEVILEENNVSTAGWVEMLRDPKNQGLQARYKLIRNSMDYQNGQNLKWQEKWQIVRFTLADKTAMLHENQAYFKALAEETRRPFTGKSNVKVPGNFMANYTDVFAVLGRSRHIANDAILDLLRIETALYRYKGASGGFPASLSQLAPTYLPVVPIDPFTGTAQQPYHYEPQDGGKHFSLYGLGTDMADNAGNPTRFPGAAQPGDMVAGHLGPPRKKP